MLAPADSLHHAAELIAQADGLVIAAGAGLGVDSGLPDFRGTEGFWRAYPALARAGIRFESIASPEAFRRAPDQAWGFYGHRLALYRATRPHAGFGLLRRWADRLPLGHFVFTSNVDGQFQQAGYAPDQLHECHGSLHRLQCLRPCSDATWPADGLQPDVDPETGLWRGALPQCPRCGGVARPAVLMFGDPDWQSAEFDAQRLRLERWLGQTRRPVVVEIGAGEAIPSVRHFGHLVLHLYGGRLVRINPRDFSVPSPRDVGLASGALAALQALDALID